MSIAYMKYLQDIQKTKPFTLNEEFTMFKLYSEKKSLLVRNKIVESNMRFVLRTALEYKSSKVNIEDLITAGSIGMIKAIDQFDYTLGKRFITYANWWIKSYIVSAINLYKNNVHIPWNKIVLAVKAQKKNNDELTMLDKEAMAVMSLNATSVSLDSPVKSDSRNTYSEIISNHKDDIQMSMNNDIISMLLNSLPEDEKHVLCEYHGINSDKPHSLREIGSSMGFSHSRIKQIRDQAMRRIKKYTSPSALEAAKEMIYDSSCYSTHMTVKE